MARKARSKQKSDSNAQFLRLMREQGSGKMSDSEARFMGPLRERFRRMRRRGSDQMSDQMSDSDAYLSGLLNQSSGEATAGLAVSDAEFMVPLREQLSRSRMSGARMSPAQSLGTQGARMSPAQSLGTGPVMSGPAGISEELGALAPDQVLDE